MIRLETPGERSFSRRALLLGAAQGSVGLLLVGRMAQLAIEEGSKYTLLAEDNRVALRLVAPRRGWIVDRRGKPLALNRPDYRLEIIPDEADDFEAVLARLAELLPLSPEEVARIRDEAAARPGYLSVAVAQGLSWERFAAINVALPDLPGVEPVRGFSRLYPGGAAYGHLLGYMAAPTAEQFAETRDRLLLLPGFKVGKDGLERMLDERLRGKPGARREEVTARGRPVRELEATADTPGATVRLTIDRDLQDFAARRIGSESASIVVMDCWTGDVLCMVSLPAFDPNAFSDGISRAEWAAMQGDERHPLVNKTTGGTYPPGSTFKPVTALAILAAGISPEAGVVCRGRYRFGGHDFHCWSRRGHGGVNMHSGLSQSCDTYFYHYGHLAGMDRIAAMSKLLGLGQEFPLPVPSQRDGIVPSPAWKQDRYGKAWLPGETLSCAIGQGYVSTTPLQLAVMTARLASGRAVVPRLLIEGSPAPAPLLSIPPEHLAIVRQGMEDVVNSGRGSGRAARLGAGDFALAGKTGTAQVRRITMAERRRGVRSNAGLPWAFRDHALFIAYAPADAPRYAMSVLVEHGGGGAKVAAPIARDVMRFLFAPGDALADLAKIEEAMARRESARRAAIEAETARVAAERAAAMVAVAGEGAP